MTRKQHCKTCDGKTAQALVYEDGSYYRECGCCYGRRPVRLRRGRPADQAVDQLFEELTAGWVSPLSV